MRIETKRLFLREMTEQDFDALYEIWADPDTMRYYPAPLDAAGVQAWIAKNRDRYRVFGFGGWAVCLKETGELIGACGLTMQRIQEKILPEIGYHIRRDKQRCGYAKEAAIAVRDWTFTHTPFLRVYSYMKDTNIPSRKTAVAWGGKLVHTYPDETNGTTVVYAMTKEAWQKGGNGYSIRTNPMGKEYDMDIIYKVKTDKSFDNALADLKANLGEHAFGVLWELDFRETLGKKGFDFNRNYRVLEVCNPEKAHEILHKESEVGFFLPCKMVVYEEDDTVYLGMLDPSVIIKMLDNPELHGIAEEVEKTLKTVIEETR